MWSFFLSFFTLYCCLHKVQVIAKTNISTASNWFMFFSLYLLILWNHISFLSNAPHIITLKSLEFKTVRVLSRMKPAKNPVFLYNFSKFTKILSFVLKYMLIFLLLNIVNGFPEQQRSWLVPLTLSIHMLIVWFSIYKKITLLIRDHCMIDWKILTLNKNKLSIRSLSGSWEWITILLSLVPKADNWICWEWPWSSFHSSRIFKSVPLTFPIFNWPIGQHVYICY